MMNKKTTFTDFIACAEDLLKRGYGSKNRLVMKAAALEACSWARSSTCVPTCLKQRW
jgi:Protease II